MRYFVIFSCRKNDHLPCENSVFSLQLFPTLTLCAFVWAGWAGFQSMQELCEIPRVCCGYFRTWYVPRLHNCVKIPRFCHGYFQLMCVMRQESCKNSVFSLWLFPACVCMYVCVCVYVCVCAVMRHSRVKIPCFHCGYFWLMCLCVTQQESCENSVFSLWLSPAYMCTLVLFVQTGPGQLQGAHLNCRNFQI